MRRRPPVAAALAVSLTKSVVILLLALLGFGLVGGSVAAAPETSPMPVVAPPSPVEQAMERHECSTTGFEAGVIPASALVRQDEQLRHVTFDEGWAVFTDEAPGTLVAVCLGDLATETGVTAPLAPNG